MSVVSRRRRERSTRQSSASADRFSSLRRQGAGSQLSVDLDGTVVLNLTAHDPFGVDHASLVVGCPLQRVPGRIVAKAEAPRTEFLVAALVHLRVADLPDVGVGATVDLGSRIVHPSEFDVTPGPTTGVSIVRAWVPAGEADVVVGRVVRVSLFTEAPLVAVASSALVGRNHLGPAMFVEVDRALGRFARRRVHPGAQFDDKITILAGLEPGERVVARGASALESAIAELNSRQRRTS